MGPLPIRFPAQSNGKQPSAKDEQNRGFPAGLICFPRGRTDSASIAPETSVHETTPCRRDAHPTKPTPWLGLQQPARQQRVPGLASNNSVDGEILVLLIVLDR